MAHVHFIGIGGTGLSAIARVLLERGEVVTGSDRQDSPLVESLRRMGARVFIGHAAGQVQGADLVIRSSAVPDDNVEVQAAQDAGIPVLKRADYLGQLLKDRHTIAVAGSHGKTTTTAMVAWMLEALNQRPSFIAGGVVQNLGVNARAGNGQTFVIEADEYDYMFLGMNPDIAVVTNVEHDHPDMFPTAEDFHQAFRRFSERIKPGGTLVGCLDDPGAADLLANTSTAGKRTLSYGLETTGADYTAQALRSRPGKGFTFEASRGEERLAQVALRVPGRHNVLNALAALVVADILNLSLEEAGLALAEFRGAGRRFEVLGEADGVTVIDDYGHHPTEIRATLAAARARYPQRPLWAVWQPHTYSRTRQMLAEFAAAFEDADHVLITEVYAAREQKPEGFSTQEVLAAVKHPDVRFRAELDQAVALLTAELRPGDVLIVLSAGDAVEISARVYQRLLDEERQNA